MARTRTVKKEKKVKNVKKAEDSINVEEIKEKLTYYINKEIKKEFNEQIDKNHKRLIREKNKKILFRNIIILILITIIGFLLYLLYSVNYFDQYFNKSNTNNVIVEELKENTKEKTLDDLKEEYAKLLDNITISSNSNYLSDYYKGNLTSELKNYLALNLIDFNTLEKEDKYNIITDQEIKDIYSKLFNDEYKSVSFNYNGNKVHYLNKLNSYITDSILEKDSTNIKREIIKIEEKDNEVIIYTKEKVSKTNETYNVKYKFKERKLISIES